MNIPVEKPILIQRYPGLEEKVPWTALGNFPTPIQRLTRVGPANLWIKRDDLSSHIYGGNKIRKLEHILADVQEKKKKKVVTMGGIGTNHGLATAIFCHRLGIGCDLLLFKQPVTKNVKQNLRLFYRYGTNISYRKTLWGTVFDFYLLHRIRQPGAYFLFAGGSTPLGTVGFVNAAFELKDQIDQGEMPEPKKIFCALGSNGTLAGLALGAKLAGLKSHIVGIRVTAPRLGPFPASTPKAVDTLVRQTHGLLRKCCPEIPGTPVPSPEIVDNYFGGAYGRVTETGRATYHLVKEKEGIALDPTYTAKTFAGVLDAAKKEDTAPVLYWHTYNSVDMTAEAAAVDPQEMAEPLHAIVTGAEIPFP